MVCGDSVSRGGARVMVIGIRNSQCAKIPFLPVLENDAEKLVYEYLIRLIAPTSLTKMNDLVGCLIIAEAYLFHVSFEKRPLKAHTSR